MLRITGLFLTALFLGSFCYGDDPSGVRDKGGQVPIKATKTPWLDSKLVGTPDPPPAFSLERAYPKISFQGPVSLHTMPHRPGFVDRMVVLESTGKLFSFEDRDDVSVSDLMIDLVQPPPKESEFTEGRGLTLRAYSIAFHPNFASNHYVYVCYVVNDKNVNYTNGTHIARYEVSDTEIPTLVHESETTILRCDSGGHNGCTLVFGPDGYLYISIGDLHNPTPPDVLRTGQDISDLYSSILRIDVDRPSRDTSGNELAYSIPSDNPFVHIPSARGEVYAFGFRNPWRMSFDRVTGELWVGDVGWEAYEMVYRVIKGGNYGWSVKEGPGDAIPNQSVGPTPILAPDIALSHSDAASVTGGYVYRGKLHPSLYERYIFGDWTTRRFWSVKYSQDKIESVQEIAYGEVKPVCFELDRNGELLVLEYVEWNQAGGIYRFVSNPASKAFIPDAFPKKLSQTGVFQDTQLLVPAKGVYTYELNSTIWEDDAKTAFHLAVPGQDPVTFFQSPQPTFDWFQSKVKFPTGTVLVKTYTVETESNDCRKVETQIGHYGGVNDWRFYTYRWLEDGSDAELVDAEGYSETIQRKQKTKHGQSLNVSAQWNYAARSQCRICHTPWSGDSLGLIEEQLRRPNAETDSWRQLLSENAISYSAKDTPQTDSHFTAMAAVNDHERSFEVRARSYLHSNCAHCHQLGGVGSSIFDVRFDRSIQDMKAIDELPMKGNCGLDQAKLIAAGDPSRSVLLYRMAKSGSGRMPHIGTKNIDSQGVRLIQNWISLIPRDPETRNFHSILTAPISKTNTESRLQAAKQLLRSPSSSMLIANSMADNALPTVVRDEVLKLANESPQEIRDIFEPWMPESMQIVRLGSQFDRKEFLAIPADAIKGGQLLMNNAGQCIQCHQIEGNGRNVGPKLDGIALKYRSPSELLDQIISPSLKIDPEYRSVAILTDEDETIIGRVVSRDSQQIHLMLSDGKERTVSIDSIQTERVVEQSTMPEGLLAALTPQQAADILAFLTSLNQISK